MVRLKVNGGKHNRLNTNISIPYGAIKSVGLQTSVLAGTAFQFLMVRLKGLPTFLLSYNLQNFNSLWCD